MKKYLCLLICLMIPLFGARFGAIQYELPPTVVQEWEIMFAVPNLFRLYVPISILDSFTFEDPNLEEIEEMLLVSILYDENEKQNLLEAPLPQSILYIDPTTILTYHIDILDQSPTSTLYQWEITFENTISPITESDEIENPYMVTTIERTFYGWTRLFLGPDYTLISYITKDPRLLDVAHAVWVPALQQAYDTSDQ